MIADLAQALQIVQDGHVVVRLGAFWRGRSLQRIACGKLQRPARNVASFARRRIAVTFNREMTTGRAESCEIALTSRTRRVWSRRRGFLVPWKKTSLGGVVLAFGLTTCVATPVNPGQTITPSAMEAKKAALLALCPPPLQLSEAEASKLPIHVTRWGNSGPRVLIIHGGEQTINALGGGPKNFAKQEVLGQQGWRLELPDRPGFGESPS
jgi:hypothetical protein